MYSREFTKNILYAGRFDFFILISHPTKYEMGLFEEYPGKKVVPCHEIHVFCICQKCQVFDELLFQVEDSEALRGNIASKADLHFSFTMH